MNDVNRLAKALVESAEVRDKKKTSAYDTTARVVKVEGTTAWVAIPGGVDKTPAMMAVNAKAGDDVRVRVAGGKAYVMGNTTAPPTDDALAKAAQDNAIRAAAAAEKASVSAETAHTAANNALRDAATAQESADIAQTAANNAVEDAARAHAAADAAQEDATIAKDAADTAKESADQALWGLSTVEDVVGTLNWITAHGTMTLTSDTAINPAHVYFVVDADGDYEVGGTHYSIVTEPKVEDISTYYELTVDESLQNYVGSHLALTSEGLWVLPAASGYKVLIATGQGTTYTEAGTYIIDGNGSTVAKFGANETQIGEDNAPHVNLTGNAFQLFNCGGNENFRLHDARNPDGTVTNMFIGTGTDTMFGLVPNIWHDSQPEDAIVTVDGATITSGYSFTASGAYIIFTPAPSQGAVIEVSYTPASGLGTSALPSLTFGTRKAGVNGGMYPRNSATFGEELISGGANSVTAGRYNNETNGFAFAIGNGSADNNRSNAISVGWDGNVRLFVDTAAAAGTTDGDLYAAINALGWTSEVIE